MKTYTVGEIAKKLNVTPYTLRYYDKEGLLPFAKRDKAGRRIFEEKDLELFGVIECLKKTGMPIKEISDFVRLYMQGDKAIGKRKKIFEQQKELVQRQIEDLQGIYDYLNYATWFMGKAEEAGTIDVKFTLKEKDVPQELRAYKKKFDAMHTKKEE